MGHGVQEKKIAKYERRKQREAPACRLRTLFEQNDAVRQTFTVTVGDDCGIPKGTLVHAHAGGPSATHLAVTNEEGRRLGAIGGAAGRVLGAAMREHRQAVVPLTVTGVVPVSGDLQVRIIPSNK